MGKTRNTGYLQNIVQYDENDNIILPSLIGSGSRIVVVNASGLLSTTSTLGNTYISDLAWSKITGAPAFLTAESDTLASVTARGASTNSAIIINNTLAVNTSTPYDTTQFALDVNGGLIIKNTGKTAQLAIINSNPASGGNAGFVIHTVGGTSGSSYADIQGYYGTSIAGSTVIRLNPLGGNVLIGSLAGSGSRMVVADATGVLSTQALVTLGDLSGVPTTRTLTINGTTYDLSANRTWTLTTTSVAEGTNLYYTSTRANSDFDTRLVTKSTTDLAEGTHLYYTDARVGTYLTNNSYATQTYVATQIANLVNAAPTTLDTLSELATALGNDANFATTTATSLGNRLRIDVGTQSLTSTQQGYGRTNLGLGTAATSNTGDFAAASHTHSIANVTGLQTALDAKEPTITAGTTSQYWRGDKTWQALPTYTLSGLGGVPTTRSITINGTAYDLSADRSWTINSMVYPGAGIAVSTGTAWGTSITNNSTNWNTAYGWGNHASAGYLTSITSGQVTTALGYTPYNSTNPNGYISSYTETDTLAAVTGRGATTSTAIDVQNRVYSRADQTTAYTSAALWTQSFTGSLTGIAFHVSGVVGRMLHMNASTTDGNLYWNNTALVYNSGTWGINVTGSAGSVAWTNVTGRPTNISSFTNDAGYITGYTETDTLATVTARGATTNAGITVSGRLTANGAGTYAVTGSSTQRYIMQALNTSNSVNAVYGWWWFHNTNGDMGFHADAIGDILTLTRAGGASINGNTILTAGNISSYALAASGATMTGILTFNITSVGAPNTSDQGTRIKLFDNTDNTQDYTIGIESQTMWFNTDYNFRWYRRNSQVMNLDSSGNLSVGGNIYLSNNSAYAFGTGYWAGTGGYPGYSYTGGNSRFGFSSSAGVIDVYADGNFYATDNAYLVLHTSNFSSYALPLSGGSLSGNLGMGTSMITYTSYDTPNMIVAGGGDVNWTFGSSHADSSNYWMQVKFYGTADDNRGFRVYDVANSTVPFRVNGAGNTYIRNNLYAGNAIITPTIYSGGGPVTFGNNVYIAPSSAAWAEGLSFTMSSTSTWGGLRWRRERSNYDGNWAVGYTALDSSDDLVFVANNGGSQVNNILRLSKDGIVSAKYGYVSYGNPWGTSDSAYFPNGITTAGGTNWIYGHTYVGNAPSNGTGCEMWADGNARFTGQLTLSNYAVNAMQPGAMNIGRIDRDYRWDGTSWAGDVKVGILANCSDYWELAIHNSGQSVMSGLYYDGGSTFYIGRSIGWGTCSLVVGGDVTAYSDKRVKENIVSIDNALVKTLGLRGVYFNRTDSNDKSTKVGVIAQEVQEIIPELVTEMEGGLLGVSYGNMAGLFIEAIKEQQTQIESQKTEIEELKDLVKQLINR